MANSSTMSTIACAELQPREIGNGEWNNTKILEYDRSAQTYSVCTFSTKSLDVAVSIYNAIQCSEHTHIVECVVFAGLSASDVMEFIEEHDSGASLASIALPLITMAAFRPLRWLAK